MPDNTSGPAPGDFETPWLNMTSRSTYTDGLDVYAPALTADRPMQDGDEDLFAVDVRDAMMFLSSHRAPPRLGSFDFLSLPSELRNLVYECALVSLPGGCSVVAGISLLRPRERIRPLRGNNGG